MAPAFVSSSRKPFLSSTRTDAWFSGNTSPRMRFSASSRKAFSQICRAAYALGLERREDYITDWSGGVFLIGYSLYGNATDNLPIYNYDPPNTLLVVIPRYQPSHQSGIRLKNLIRIISTITLFFKAIVDNTFIVEANILLWIQ